MDSTSVFAPQMPSLPIEVPAPSSEAATQSLTAVGAGERCPSCGGLVASDQRYCLECGQRRGDPRLPFMDALVFMNAVTHHRREAAPSPAPRHRSRLSPSGTLIGGIGTLLLAMGVGVLIGHSGSSGGSGAAKAPVQVLKVPATAAPTTTAPEASTPAAKPGKAKTASAHHSGGGGGGKAAAAASGSGGGAASVLHPVAKLPPPTVQVGGACHSGAGCEGGKFTGHFFGE